MVYDGVWWCMVVYGGVRWCGPTRVSGVPCAHTESFAIDATYSSIVSAGIDFVLPLLPTDLTKGVCNS